MLEDTGGPPGWACKRVAKAKVKRTRIAPECRMVCGIGVECLDTRRLPENERGTGEEEKERGRKEKRKKKKQKEKSNESRRSVRWRE